MRAVEFNATINEAGQLTIPEAAADALPAGTQARVIVLLPDGDDPVTAAWDRLAARNISDYYSPEDAIYDDDPRG